MELMRQGAAGSARVAAAARLLQSEAKRTSLTAKAAMGAIYKAGEDPFRIINIQFDPKYGKVEAEGDKIQVSIKKMRNWNGEYADAEPPPESPAQKAAKKIEKAKKLKERAFAAVQAAKAKVKRALEKAKELAIKKKKTLAAIGAVTGAAAVTSAVIESKKTPKLAETETKQAGIIGEDPEAMMAAAIALCKARESLAQRRGASFLRSVEPSRPQRQPDRPRYRGCGHGFL